MKICKIISALIVCIFVAFTFVSCGGNNMETTASSTTEATVETTEEKAEETTTEETTAEKITKEETSVADTTAETTTKKEEKNPETLEDIGLDYYKLYSANLFDNLMENNESISIHSVYSDGSETRTEIFKYDRGIVKVEKIKDPDGGELVDGWMKGYDFRWEEDRVKAYKDVEDLHSTSEFSEKEYFTAWFEDYTFVPVEVTDEYYKLRYVFEGMEDKVENYFYFDKESLALLKTTFDNSVGYKEETTITYNGELSYEAGIMKLCFEENTKTVKIVSEMTDGDTVSNLTTELKLPYDWEYIPTSDNHIAYYPKEDFSGEYEYPGNGEDYALYITNSFG